MSTNIPWWFTKAYKTIKLLLPELSQAKYTRCELLMRCLIPHSLTTHRQQRENSVGHLYTIIYNFVHLSTIQRKIMWRMTFEIVVTSSPSTDLSSLTRFATDQVKFMRLRRATATSLKTWRWSSNCTFPCLKALNPLLAFPASKDDVFPSVWAQLPSPNRHLSMKAKQFQTQ